jgi:N6-L-threonylcarbamoyladenine synthase
LDDAAGEAFDKVARLLDLGYPGGPAIQTAAEEGDPKAFDFPRAWLDESFNFSFSGLKTAVLRTVQQLKKQKSTLPISDLAASFQAAVIDVLFQKTIQAAEEFETGDILIAGGVSANSALRGKFTRQRKYKVHIPPLSLCTDNAAMIAGAGCYRFAAGQRDDLEMDAAPTWSIADL